MCTLARTRPQRQTERLGLGCYKDIVRIYNNMGSCPCFKNQPRSYGTPSWLRKTLVMRVSKRLNIEGYSDVPSTGAKNHFRPHNFK